MDLTTIDVTGVSGSAGRRRGDAAGPEGDVSIDAQQIARAGGNDFLQRAVRDSRAGETSLRGLTEALKHGRTSDLRHFERTYCPVRCGAVPGMPVSAPGCPSQRACMTLQPRVAPAAQLYPVLLARTCPWYDPNRLRSGLLDPGSLNARDRGSSNCAGPQASWPTSGIAAEVIEGLQADLEAFAQCVMDRLTLDYVLRDIQWWNGRSSSSVLPFAVRRLVAAVIHNLRAGAARNAVLGIRRRGRNGQVY